MVWPHVHFFCSTLYLLLLQTKDLSSATVKAICRDIHWPKTAFGHLVSILVQRRGGYIYRKLCLTVSCADAAFYTCVEHGTLCCFFWSFLNIYVSFSLTQYCPTASDFGRILTMKYYIFWGLSLWSSTSQRLYNIHLDFICRFPTARTN